MAEESLWKDYSRILSEYLTCPTKANLCRAEAIGKIFSEKKIPLSRVINLHLDLIKEGRLLLTSKNLSNSRRFLKRVIRSMNTDKDAAEALVALYDETARILLNLRESERECQSLRDNEYVGIYKFNLKGDILCSNKALARMLEFESPEEMVAEGIRYKDPTDFEVLIENLKKKRKIENFETEVLTKTGRSKTILLSAVLEGSVASGFAVDITDLRMAEKALQREREIAQRYLDIAGVIIVVIGSDQKVNLINRKGCEILEYSREEILGKNWFDNFIPEEIRSSARSIFDRLISGETEGVEYCETPIVTRSGEERIIAWYNTVLRDDDGKIVGTLSSGEDITEHKEAEKALKESELKYRTLVQTARDAIITVDSQANIVSWNYAAETIFGYSAEEAIGKPLTIIIPDRFRRDFKKGMKKILDGRSNISGKTVEWVGLRKDGTEFLAEISINMWTTQEGTFFTSIIRDITRRKKMEEKLKGYIKELEAVHEIDRNILEKLELPSLLEFVVNKSIELTGADAAFFGLIEGDEIRHHTSAGTCTDALQTIRLKKGTGLGWLAIQENKPIVVEDFFTDKRLKDAPYDAVREEGLVSFLAVPVTSRGGDPLGILYVANRRKTKFTKQQQRALTTLASQSSVAIEYAKLLEETKKAYEELKTLDVLKSNIISNVSHELRTPITMIMGALELAREEKDPIERDKYLRIALEAIRRQDRIVENLVEAARIERMGIKLTLEEIDIETLITLAVAEFKPRTVKKALELRVEVEGSPRVIGDYIHLSRVLANLLDNAVKFNREGGRIVVSARKRDGEVLVCVSDTGIGIPRGELERVFDRFYQVDSSTSRPYGGMGMGLAVAKEIVEAHGGRIWAESRPGEGSKFYFTLPLYRSI